MSDWVDAVDGEDGSRYTVSFPGAGIGDTVYSFPATLPTGGTKEPTDTA